MAGPAQIKATVTKMLLLAVRQRQWLWLAVTIGLALAALAASRARYTSNLAGLFPAGSETARTAQVLADSGMTQRLWVDIQAPGPAELEAATPWLDQIAANLAAVPGITRVDFRFRRQPLAEALAALTPCLPQIVSPDDIRTHHNPEQIVARAWKMLAQPTVGAIAMLREDPFGARTRLLLKLQTLRRLSGLEFSEDHPFMATPDGSRAAMLLATTIPYSDGKGARRLLADLNRVLADAPDGFTCHLLGPHNHTVGNEDVLRRDLTVVSVLSGLFLVALFFVVYRGSPQAFWIPFFPLAGSLAATGLAALLWPDLYLFVIGLGGGLIGLAVDQGIHAYAAFRGRMAPRRLAGLAGPLLAATVTSAGSFALAMTTGSPALIQLGLFAVISLLLSLTLTFFLLPTVLRPTHAKATFPAPRPSPRLDRAVIATWLFILVVASAAALAFLKTSFRFEAFDGAPETVRAQEADFQAAWQTSAQPALLIVTNNPAAKLEDWQQRLRDMETFAPTELWPAPATRAAHLARWRELDVDSLEQELATAAASSGLPAAFFSPFFTAIRTGLAQPPAHPPALVQSALNLMLSKQAGTLFFADEPELVNRVRTAARPAETDYAVVSPEAFKQMLASDFTGRLLRALAAAGVAVVLIVALFLRSLRLTVLALAPVVTTALVLGGFLAVTGIPLNLIIALAGIILTGLTIDYGIFAVQASQDGPGSGIPAAMGMSAATTVFATAALLFSKHPILFHIGLALTVGITVAYLTGLLVVPALLRLGKPQNRVPLLTFGLSAAILLSGCCSFQAAATPELTERLRQELTLWRQQAPRQARFQAKVTLSNVFASIPMLVAGEVNQEKGTIVLAGLSPTGARLFTIASQNGTVSQLDIASFFPQKHAKILRDLHQHFYHLLFFNTPELPADFRYRNRELLFTNAGPGQEPVQYRFSGTPLALQTKTRKGLLTTRWQCQYTSINRGEHGWQPGVSTARLAGSAFRCDLDFIRFTILAQPRPKLQPTPN